jgi:hypothetical protein
MDPATRSTVVAVLGSAIFIGSLWLPWESYFGLCLSDGWRVVGSIPVLPYAPLLGALLGAAGAVAATLNLVGARLQRLLMWSGFLLLLFGFVGGLYQLAMFLSVGVGSVGRGAVVGSIGAVLELSSLRKLTAR